MHPKKSSVLFVCQRLAERGLALFLCTARHDALGDALGHVDVVAGLHGILAAALRFAAQVGGVTEHIGQRNERIDLLRAAAGLGTLDLAARCV